MHHNNQYLDTYLAFINSINPLTGEVPEKHKVINKRRYPIKKKSTHINSILKKQAKVTDIDKNVAKGKKKSLQNKKKISDGHVVGANNKRNTHNNFTNEQASVTEIDNNYVVNDHIPLQNNKIFGDGQIVEVKDEDFPIKQEEYEGINSETILPTINTHFEDITSVRNAEIVMPIFDNIVSIPVSNEYFPQISQHLQNETVLQIPGRILSNEIYAPVSYQPLYNIVYEPAQLPGEIIITDSNEESYLPSPSPQVLSPANDTADLVIVLDEEDSEMTVQLNDFSKNKTVDVENNVMSSEIEKLQAPFKEQWPSDLWDRGAYNLIFCGLPRTTDETFFHYCRLLPHQFELIYNLIGSALWSSSSKKFSSKDFIHPKVELALTISFLTKGFTFKQLAREFHISTDPIPSIIFKVCNILAEGLEPLYLHHQLEVDWLKTSNSFWDISKFPHTLGAIHGKTFQIQNGSVTLLASSDLDNNFIWSSLNETATMKAKTDSIFQELRIITACLPLTSCNTSLNMPHFFVGSEHLPLLVSVMSPYKGRGLSQHEQLFNRRVVEVTKAVQRSFNMLANRFWLYKKKLTCTSSVVQAAMRATIPLYNLLRKSGTDIHCPLQVRSKLEDIYEVFGAESFSHAAILNRDIVAKYMEPQPQDIMFIEYDADVIVIE